MCRCTMRIFLFRFAFIRSLWDILAGTICNALDTPPLCRITVQAVRRLLGISYRAKPSLLADIPVQAGKRWQSRRRLVSLHSNNRSLIPPKIEEIGYSVSDVRSFFAVRCMPVYEMAGNWVRLALCGMVGQVVYKGLHLLLGMNLMGMVDNHTLLFIGKRTEALHGFGALCQGHAKAER